MDPLPDAIVYTHTMVHSPAERFVADAPYQIAIVDVEGLGRRTVRILSEISADRVAVGERVRFVEYRDGVAYYTRLTI